MACQHQARARHVPGTVSLCPPAPAMAASDFVLLVNIFGVEHWQNRFTLFNSLSSSITAMPIPLLAEGFGRGISNLPYLYTILQSVAAIGVVALLKLYFAGAKCGSERVMHGRVVMVTVGN